MSTVWWSSAGDLMQQPITHTLVSNHHFVDVKKPHNALDHISSGKNHVGPLWVHTDDFSAFPDGFFLEQNDLAMCFAQRETAAMDIAGGITRQLLFHRCQGRESAGDTDQQETRIRVNTPAWQ